MAVGGNVSDFDLWLSDKLLAFNTDESVFSSYIRGILEGEESPDEKKEALEVILSEMTEENISKICQEILEKWNLLGAENGRGHKSVLEVAEDVDVKLARLIESQAQATTVRNSNYTDEEKRIREAILLQYGQLSDDEEQPDVTPSASGEVNKSSLERNTNATSVMQAEKEKREKAKLDSQKKKEKDREDREKQKQLQQEKKEKRKPQKGERRR